MSISALLDHLRREPDCVVSPPTHVPNVDLPLPDGVEEFYRGCGGASLFQGSEYSIELVRPGDFVRANPVIVGEDGDGDISYEWFVVARSDSQFITIDLSESRSGRCYDSFWDVHAVVGSCDVIATSFESLIRQLIVGRGQYWFWLQDDFEQLGDAYDQVAST